MAGYSSNSIGPRSRGVDERLSRVVMRRDNRRCQIQSPECTGRAFAVDHIIPVFEGGTDDIDNLQAVCIPCHALKTQAEAQRSRSRVSRKRPRAPHPSEGLLRYRTMQR